MQIVFQQVFPLGRFHATPWRKNPFSDPYGEWPPSPWRLVRALISRWYQWAREATPAPEFAGLDELVRALCRSSYRFHLPQNSRRGDPLRQYFPADFEWNPRKKSEPGLKTYGKRLAQDNYWCVAPNEEGAVWWFLEGDHWTEPLVSMLDRCLERVTYFGRAEAFSRIKRVQDRYPEPNCDLSEAWGSDSVPVLVPEPDASRSDLERGTDDESNAKRSIPVGARMMYARRPPQIAAREKPIRSMARPHCPLVQLAIGWNVPPETSSLVRLTSRFRGAVLRELLRVKTGDQKASWRSVSADVRDKVAEMSGKDGRGNPLKGHRHTEFFAWFEDGIPTRLLVWRGGRSFDQDEQEAILVAASSELSWAAEGSDSDVWKVRLVPLDRAVSPPPGFDGAFARSWESVAPYVPPRHYLRGGKLREGESIDKQIRRELALRGFQNAERVEVEQIDGGSWITVHVPQGQSDKRRFVGDRRGYLIRLRFPEPIQGPLRLGHSSSFGLGLFGPNCEGFCE